jgi:threonine aldolase
VLAASADRVREARVWRKRYGGGMRQVGVLAAACAYALDHHVDRLADDHARARQIAERLAAVEPRLVDPAQVETNIVVVELAATAMTPARLVATAAEQGVLVGALGASTVRLVTHLDVDDAGAERAAEVLMRLIAAG